MKVFASALLYASATAFKVGLISDMHLNPYYDSTIDVADDCWSSGSTKADDVMALARYGCDPSAEFVEMVFQRFNEAFGEVDVMLVTGDFTGHDIDPHREDYTAEAWETFKGVVSSTASMI